jgi:4-hydroxybenzoate polyprenyltransferase
MNNLFGSVKNYFSLVKFSHTVFAMPFALIGYSLAVSEPEYNFSLRLLLLILLCMVFARNAAMGFNRLADKKFDALNPRTKNREIPSGIIGSRAAAIFVIFNAVLFIVITSFINRLTLYLSPVALLIILGYSLTKRFTFMCHFILGLGLSLAPIGAYISLTGKFSIIPLVYAFIVLTWVSGFDIIYALQDDEFDRSNNLHSVPSTTGIKNAIVISIIVHIITFILVVLAGFTGNGGWIYWTGASLFSVFLIYQHLMVRHNDLSRVTLAFSAMNGVASIIFAIFVILDLFFRYQ